MARFFWGPVEIRKVGEVQFTKFDGRSGEFTGVMTSETPDDSQEVIDLPGSRDYIEAWSQSTYKRSKGKSFGNVREMHGLSAVGKLTAAPVFDMDRRTVTVQGVIVDPIAKRKTEEGVYLGLSIGGRYVKRSRHPTLPGITQYVADPTEVSLVDTPCNPDAEMQLIDSTGAMKLVKFRASPTMSATPPVDDVLLKAARLLIEHGVTKAAPTKRVGGEDLGPSAFAYVGDPTEPGTWKYPVHDKAHTRNALTRWGQEKGIPETSREAVYGRLKTAAQKYGVGISEDAEKFIKGLYDIGGLTTCLQNLEYHRRSLDSDETESDAAARVRQVMVDLASVIKDVAGEQIDALLAQSASTPEA